jgi:dipeptidyl aminopeptidase/acylaminoacyl peptidase
MASTRFIVEDLLDLKVLSDAHVSPGGDRVIFCLAENGSSKGERSPVSRVWMQADGEAAAIQLTTGPYTDRQARWSPDGSRVSFLSDREKRGTSQIYLLESGPRDARQLSALPAGVIAHTWSPSGDRIAFTASDHIAEQDNDVRLYDSDQRFQRLYLCDVGSGSTSPISHGDLHVWEFCWAPDGKSIAAIVSDDPYDWGWYDARLVIIDITSGDVRSIYETERQIARPEWSPTGEYIALVTCRWSDPGMTGGDVIVVNIFDGIARNLTEGEPRSHYTAHWAKDGNSLVTFGYERASAQVCWVDFRKGSTPLWRDDATLVDYGGTYDPTSRKFAVSLSRTGHPPEVWVGLVPAVPEEVELLQLTTSNRSLEMPASTTVWLSWRSTDGMTIEGFLVRPAHVSPEDAAPMVTLIHGGPTAVATPSFPMTGAAAWTPFLVEHGISVFIPNYRGSNGYGVAFAEANVGDLGGLDLQDVLTGVDECVRRGLAVESRLGIGGWSYGGYLTAWAITQTPRFSAAVAGAPITNWYSFHGGSNIPRFDSQFICADPHELDGPYAWTSPLFFSKNVKTPVLFVHGEQDPCCPVGQSYEMARALRRLGVRTECAVYPREPHGFIEREHRKDMIERSVSWFKTWLGAL